MADAPEPQETVAIHIYRARDQPATRQVIELGDGRPWIFRLRPHQRVQCFTCRRLRLAKNAIAHVYYDGTYYFCRDREDCKRHKGRRRRRKR
jgi:hypothetical protein